MRPSTDRRPDRPEPRRGAGRGRPAEAGTGSEERLQKTLARAGFGSRRSAEDLIRTGRVTIDGRVASLGDRVEPARHQVAVDGVPIPADPDLRYFVLNKPRGVTTTMRDPHAERTVAPLLPRGPRVFPVGRLDRDSEGLLLLTNDGELAHRIQHPRHGMDKEYLVEVDGELGADAVRRLLSGIELEDGPARADAVGRVQRSRGRSSITVVVREGRKRLVRRMFAELRHPVRRLVRIRVGPIRLGGLRPGETRPVEAHELLELYRDAGLRRARPGRRARRGT
jgi:23S rRNA pseudouridine2605 synthase